MAAKLTSGGILFSDSTTISKREWIFPAGTNFTFWASAAPTGWTKQTTHNDKALRLVSGTGGGSGGSQPFTTVCSPTFKYAGTLNTSTETGLGLTNYFQDELPSHQHPAPAAYKYIASPLAFNPAGQFIGYTTGDVKRSGGTIDAEWNPIYNLDRTGTVVSPTGVYVYGNNGHAHPVSASGPVNTPFTLGVRYMNIIVCSFDG